MSEPGNWLDNASALDLLTRALTGASPVTNEQVQRTLYDFASRPVLDPIQAAAAQSDPRYLRAAQAAQAELQKRQAIHLDGGAVALDVLARRMAGDRLRLNLSGARTMGRPVYPIAPGVQYERQLVKSRLGGKGGEVEFIRFDDTPMGDWDLPHPSHMSGNVTVRNLGDVEELIQGHVSKNPQSEMRLYMTPGGFRAWELGERRTPAEHAKAMEAMRIDGDYTRLAQQGNPREIEGVPVGQPGFSARISAKPGRSGDWVALPIATIAGEQAAVDPVSAQRVRAYHDQPIASSYLPGGQVPHAAQAMLKEQAATASLALQQALRRRGLL